MSLLNVNIVGGLSQYLFERPDGNSKFSSTKKNAKVTFCSSELVCTEFFTEVIMINVSNFTCINRTFK